MKCLSTPAVTSRTCLHSNHKNWPWLLFPSLLRVLFKSFQWVHPLDFLILSRFIVISERVLSRGSLFTFFIIFYFQAVHHLILSSLACHLWGTVYLLGRRNLAFSLFFVPFPSVPPLEITALRSLIHGDFLGWRKIVVLSTFALNFNYFLHLALILSSITLWQICWRFCMEKESKFPLLNNLFVVNQCLFRCKLIGLKFLPTHHVWMLAGTSISSSSYSSYFCLHLHLHFLRFLPRTQNEEGTCEGVRREGSRGFKGGGRRCGKEGDEVWRRISNGFLPFLQ